MNPEDQDSFPPVPDALLKKLNEVFPHKSPEIGETRDELMWRGGQRALIDWLEIKSQDNNLDIQDVFGTP